MSIDKIFSNNSLTEVSFFKNKLIAIDDTKLMSQNLLDSIDNKIFLIENEFE